MKNFLYVSTVILSLLAMSCVSSMRSGCGQAKSVHLTSADIPSVIVATDSLQTFDVEISFFGKHINGMMFVKKQDAKTVRILINSYFGMSMGDFELSADTFVVHYLLDAMNKPFVVDIFYNDFKLLLGFHLPDYLTALESVCIYPEKFISFETQDGKYKYRINGENQSIGKIKAPGLKVEIPYHKYPRTIILKHRAVYKPTMVIKEMK